MKARGNPVSGERGPELIGTLGEVRPAVEVQGDHRLGAQDQRCLRCEVARQRQVRAVEEVRDLDRASEQDRDVDRIGVVGDLPDGVERGIVARDVDGGQSGAAEHEADHRTAHGFGARRAVQRRDRGYGHRSAVCPAKLERIPRLEPARVAAEPGGSLARGQYAPGARQKIAARRVEVVAVLVVGEQDEIDRFDRLRR